MDVGARGVGVREVTSASNCTDFKPVACMCVFVIVMERLNMPYIKWDGVALIAILENSQQETSILIRMSFVLLQF